jgi:hypothetical protein
MPVSEYDNYTFNSLAYAPHEMIGCTDQGVYTMTGDDDAGAPIAAELTSMMLDFATSRQKRLSAAWIGYKADGELVLRVRAVDMDELVEYCFVGRNVSGRRHSRRTASSSARGCAVDTGSSSLSTRKVQTSRSIR